MVEYALSRNLSPALVSEYKTKLIPKNILRKKLHEYYLLGEAEKDKEVRSLIARALDGEFPRPKVWEPSETR